MILSRVQAFWFWIWHDSNIDLGSHTIYGWTQSRLIGPNQESSQTSCYEVGEESIRGTAVAIVAWLLRNGNLELVEEGCEYVRIIFLIFAFSTALAKLIPRNILIQRVKQLIALCLTCFLYPFGGLV